MRKEKDSLGELEIDESALYGIHSLRAKLNFPDSTPFHIEWYQALALVKKACYLTALDFIEKAAAKINLEALKVKKMLGENALVYVKSQDNKWYLKNEKDTGSIHWSEFCQFPWSSMSILCDGRVVPCCNDYDGELVLGDANEQTLKEIWNGEPYKMLRENHAHKPNFKCSKECDMKLVGDYE